MRVLRVCTGRMRSIWKGALTFGLVNVPVKLYSATEDHDVGAAPGARRRRRSHPLPAPLRGVRQDRRRTSTSTRPTTTASARSCSPPTTWPLPAERCREIEVVEFVPNEQIDPIMFDKSYFLEPDGASPKAYVLLRRTLE